VVAIRYGLEALALRQNLRLEDSEVLPLMRMAMFNLDERQSVSEDFIAIVVERLSTTVHAPRNDTTEAFNKSIFPGKGNLVKALANQGGRDQWLDPQEVRQAILEIGWRAHLYVAGCLDACARAFLASIDEPLNQDEEQLFREMYLPRPYLGGLPLVMLMDRKALISGVIPRLWASPGNADDISTLHGLLHLYGEMATTRRRADNRIKQMNRGTKRAAIEMNGAAWQHHSVKESSDPHRDAVGLALALNAGLCCPRCERWFWHLPKPDADPVAIEIACEGGHIEHLVHHSLEDLRGLVVHALHESGRSPRQEVVAF
jgi:hypothetical protein